MTRAISFSFRINSAEKKLIKTLSVRLQRNQSDAVRWVIRESVKALEAGDGSPESIARLPTRGSENAQ